MFALNTLLRDAVFAASLAIWAATMYAVHKHKEAASPPVTPSIVEVFSSDFEPFLELAAA